MRPLFFKMNVCRHSAQTLIKRRDAKGRCAEVLLGKGTGWPAEVQWYPFFVDTSSGRLTRRTHLPVRPYIAGLHCRPARIAVSASASLSLIGVAGQQGDVGTYRQGASDVFQNERMPVQRTDVDKRRNAKGRCAEVQGIRSL